MPTVTRCPEETTHPGGVRAELGSGDELEFVHADQAAKALGIDTWDIHWRRLREKPTDPGRRYHVMARCDGDRIGHLDWDRDAHRLSASEDYCWYSWPEQVGSVRRLADYRFEWVLPGHGQRVRLPAAEMRAEVLRLAEAMGR